MGVACQTAAMRRRSLKRATLGSHKNGHSWSMTTLQAGAERKHTGPKSEPTMPTEASDDLGFFDRFATSVSHWASRAWFFAACMLLVIIWAPTIVFFNIDTWQLIINTATTIVTFLLVALLQNTQTRADQAVQHKLNAIADGLADLMRHVGEGEGDKRLTNDLKELRAAVGLEDRESAS